LEELRELRQLREENSKLKRLVADLSLDRHVLQEIVRKKGSEFDSFAMEAWVYQHGVQLDFIRPGKPVENSYIESFNGNLRDECLNGEIFTSLRETQIVIGRRRIEYHTQFRKSYCLKTTGGPPTRLPLRSTVTSTRLAMRMKGMPLFIP
jgi:transposase InsO family protein